MDSDFSVMDYGTEDGCSETQEDIPELPDDVLAIIFSDLSWKDILNTRLVSRRFYNIICRKWHLLNKREIRVFSIQCSGIYNEPVFSLDMNLKGVGGFGLYRKTIEFKGDEELLRLLKMFDMKKVDFLELPRNGVSCIFDILNRCFPIRTIIGRLTIPLLCKSDFERFRLFVESHSSIEEILIKEICSSSTRVEDVYSQLSLSSLHIIKAFMIHESYGEGILSTDLVTSLISKNPYLDRISIGTGNIELVKSVFKIYFTMDQPCKMKDKCNHNEVDLHLQFDGSFGFALDILRKELRELGNVEEEEEIDEFSNSVKFESVIECKHCYKNKHNIMRTFYLWGE